MDIQAICRVCLAHSVKMHAVISIELQELYEKMAGCKFFTEDGRPTSLCYFCYCLLQRSLCFMQAARQAESVLTQLCSAGVVFTADILSMIDRPVHSYTLTPIENVTINGEETHVKTECQSEHHEEDTKIPPSEEIKSDPENNSPYEDTNEAPFAYETDPEDDIPLNNLKLECPDNVAVNDKHKEKRVRVKVRDKLKIKVKREKRQYRKGRKIDASEVTLTKEQQLQDVLNRATSLNYLNSPYRCNLCYKGFVSHAAYLNHKEKHDERSGPHECDICKMRYQTARLLRSHTRAAHSRFFECGKCHHLSHTAHQASDHERWHNGHLYDCKLCGENFTKRTSYLSHTRARHPTGHVCRACGERFLGAHGLKMHVSKAHRHAGVSTDPSDPLDRFCSDCNIQFDTLDAWRRHIIASSKHIQHAEQTKQCEICKKRVADSIAVHMKQHERELRPPKPANDVRQPTARFACEQCGQTFIKKSKLTEHVRRIHLGHKYNKNIVCEVCAKKCTSNAALKYHQRTHTGERPHGCAVCCKRFADSNQLRIHTRTHTGEKPYSCEHCAKRFAQKPALNRHYRVHTGAKPYICDLCSKSFSQSNSLKTHVRSVHLKMPSCRRKQNQEKTQELQTSQELIKIN